MQQAAPSLLPCQTAAGGLPEEPVHVTTPQGKGSKSSTGWHYPVLTDLLQGPHLIALVTSST